MNIAGPKAAAPLLVFIGLLLIVNAPNFIWLAPHHDDFLNAAEFAERLLTSFLVAALCLSVFARPDHALLLLWLLCLWWLPLAVGVRLMTGLPINSVLIGTVAATSPAELQNLISVISLRWLLFFIVWNAALLAVWLYLRTQTQWRWPTEFRAKVAFFCAALLFMPLLVTYLNQVTPEQINAMQASLPESEQGNHQSDLLKHFTQAEAPLGGGRAWSQAFPYELPWAVAQYLQERRAVAKARANLAEPSVSVLLAPAQTQAEVVVLVIGESATRNAWHWFNPAAPQTTPLLEARAAKGEHVYAFKNVLAQTASTRQAVPSMLTDQPLVWPQGGANPNATHAIVWIAKKAGYATGWFSNQSAVGQHDGIIASYAQEAEHVAFLNPASFADRGSLDEVLIPALRRHLSQHRKVFVVLHTMGSHFDYSHRYPADFGLFNPAASPREAYFNSVAYTDWLLDHLMAELESDGRRAALVYAADHGETIPGGACQKEVPDRTSRDTYEVPALVWLSASYAHAYPVVAARLRAQQSAHYEVAAVYGTLLDLMRASTFTASANVDLPSFARSVALNTVGDHAMAERAQKFKMAVEKNPCFVILK